jgi:hypothetical protein
MAVYEHKLSKNGTAVVWDGQCRLGASLKPIEARKIN